MSIRRHRRYGAALIAALAALGLLGNAPVAAQSGPVIVPPISAVVVGLPPAIPWLGSGLPGDNQVVHRDGLTWSTSGRAQVDVDIDRHHGQAAAR